MEKHVVFIVEKPANLRALAPHLSAKWPGKAYAITTLYIGLYEFRYPRGLNMADFPFVGEPAWKKRPLESSPVFEVEAGEVRQCDLEPTDILRGASSIVFAADPSPAGAVAFHVLLSECLGADMACASWPALRLYANDDHGINKALEAANTTRDEWFESLCNAGIARRFFDFNYNINAMALFGNALRQVGGVSQDYLVSKYSLQLLFALRDHPLVGEDEDVLIRMMQEWQGTGRYTHRGLGSPVSRPAILEGLRSAGLMQGVRLSAAGHAFLGLLHPDCRDPDLPARMAHWMHGWPSSRPAVERYLRTFFGKQKRFASRSALNAPAPTADKPDLER